MSTSTVLRVKRRLEDNPQDALLLMCKRPKKDYEEVSPSLFVFQGTVHTQEPDHLKDIHKSEVKLKAAHDLNDIIQKLRKEKKESQAESRYEVVNLSRGIKDGVDLLDVAPKSKEGDKDAQYAYDLYIAAKKDLSITLDNIVSIEDYDELILGSYRDNGRKTPSSDGADDDDDSNDENNWRNEYPDSDPSSIDNDDMIKAIENCDIDDLSSDAGEDKIYDEPSDLFNEDVKRYGEAYAKYKTKVMAEDGLSNSNNFVHAVKTDEFGYKDDSDDGFYYGEEEDTDQFKDQYKDDPSSESEPYTPD